jgi:hypothetical protein
VSGAPPDERRALARWAEAFAVVNGWAPRLDDLGGGDGGDGAGDFTLTFEPRFDPIEMLGGTGHFARRPALVTHLARMGFGWDGERVLTVPSPASFNRLADRLLPPATGYRLAVIESDARRIPLGFWLHTYLAGCIPIHLGTPAFHDTLVAARGWKGERHERKFQFLSFAHDLSVHALNYQFVPRAAIEAFAARLREALPERYARWGAPDAAGPLTIATFFDNDLNRFCYALWSHAEAPADFAGLFAEHLPQLMACLDQRIEETRRGLGDVPDQDSKSLPTLAPWEFAVRARAAGPGRAAARDAGHSTQGDGVAFRDPRSPDEEARGLRLKIAHALARAPRLPVDLPAFGLRLLDVTADARGISLQLGPEQPVAALRIARVRPAAGAPVPLRLPGSSAVEVTVEPIHAAAARHERELGVMAERLRRAITPAQWDEAQGYARALRALPAGVPMYFFRQLVPGLRHPSGLVRTGFRCNQDCGICWQSRDWGGFDREAISRWIEDLAGAGVRSLIVSGGEPTLDPHLEHYLRHARALGITSLTLETNAIQCARGDLAVRLRAAGLTDAFVSLHSADAAVSDAITRAPGTHARTVKGVHALLDAGVAVKINAVMTQEGLAHLAGLPDFIHAEFGRHGNLLRKLMLSYPTDPYEQALIPAIVPEPATLRRVLAQTLERAFAVGLVPEGLDGPCGPPLCAFGADARVTSLAPIPEALPFRQYLAACAGCAVRDACFGCRTADVALYGAACAEPLARRPDAAPVPG